MITVRTATQNDAEKMASLLNEIIRIGGTTAHRTEFDAIRMYEHYIASQRSISCAVAVFETEILGFQSLAWPDPQHQGPDMIAPDWGIIATFAKVGRTQGGIGTALFQHTLDAAKRAGVTAIDATIRHENTGGQAYYNKMGFGTYRQSADTVSKEFRI